MKKRIISIILVVALTVSMLPAAHAANPLEYVRKSFWEYVYDFSHEIGNDAATVWNNTIGAFWDGFDGTPEQAYDDYVQHVSDTIGAPTISKNGYIVPIVPVDGTNPTNWVQKTFTIREYPAYTSVLLVNTEYNSYSNTSVSNDVYGKNIVGGFSYTVPQASTVSLRYDAFSSNTDLPIVIYSALIEPTSGGGAFSSGGVSAGTTLKVWSQLTTQLRSKSIHTVFFRAGLVIEPYNFDSNDFTAPIGGSGSRLTNTGINVMGSDNTVYENVSFVDETNNTFYNPTTNTTTSFTDWTYDYSTREYTLTTTDNTQVTIRYGDDSVIIQEGSNTVNNYYYAAPIANPEPTPPPAPTAHVHSWLKLQDASFAATCTTDGKDEYYCADSTCTETHTVNAAAGGHIWVGTGYVPVEYDDDGNVISGQGYTDYRCLTCNETYRQYDGQPPPSGGGGHAGSRNIFEIMFGLLADFFGFFVTLLLDFIPNSLRDFFSSITDNSSDVFEIFEADGFTQGGQSNGSGAGRP